MSKPEIYTMSIGGTGSEVTGSSTGLCIKVNGKTYFGITDAGIVQGKEEFRNLQYPLNGENLDFVIVTHAHADHFLGLPLLKKYKGKIFGTRETFTFGNELMLDGVKANLRNAMESLGISYDSYYQMLKDLESIKKRFEGGDPNKYSEYIVISDIITEIESKILYNYEDVENIKRHFCSVTPLEIFTLAKGLYARLIPTPHQDGAVSVEIYAGEITDDNCVSICFSGDIGPDDSLLYKRLIYEPNPWIKYAWLEATHGTEAREQSTLEAYNFIKNRAFKAKKRNAPLVIATFSLDRSAKVLYLINKLIDETNISIPIYWDTPLGYKELIHYQNFYSMGAKNNLWFNNLGRNPFDDNECIVCQSHAEHLDAVKADGAKLIITASAFGEGGRIIDYFDEYIQNENAEFLFAGWLSPDCSSSILLNAERGKLIDINGMHYVKHCKTTQVTGLTSHGYYPEFLNFINRFPNLKGLFLNHGDKDAKESLAKKLMEEDFDFGIEVPELYDEVENDRSFYRLDSDSFSYVPALEGYKIFEPILTNI